MLENLLQKLIFLPIILFSLSLHELSHGYAAYRLGDDTAKAYGRLTLNPLAHVDLLGTLAMLFFGFGWAKPVPVNFGNLKYKKTGTFLVAAAGPFSNFLLATLAMVIFTLCAVMRVQLHGFITEYLIYTVIINVTLAAFNLIPIPPLDGSKIVLSFLPLKWQFTVYRYEIYIQVVLFALLYIGALDPVIRFMRNLVMQAVSVLPIIILNFLN